jgi:hypothetical protein
MEHRNAVKVEKWCWSCESVFSLEMRLTDVVVLDPQRGVGLDQTPLRVTATTGR